MKTCTIMHHQHHHSLGGDYDKSMTNSSSYSVWNNFFVSAGIPDTVANEYAVTFSQHRIRIDMLKEITKEILLDMGIKAMGDIIAILRHAKNLYTQDELKGGIKASNPVCIPPNKIINQRPAAINQISQRVPITTRTNPSISSLVGGKIQSRVSLDSGALTASSNNSTINNELRNKRPTSTLSTSMAKRLRPATTTGPTLDGTRVTIPEKTLTVHYPSGAAIAKAQQRVLSGSSASISSSSRGTASVSIKSRLGTSPANGKFRSDSTISTTSNSSKNNSGNFKEGWSRNSNGARPSSSNNSPSSGKRSDSKGRSNHNDKRGDAKNQQQQQQKGRLKSTVFNRLGDGAR